MRARIAAAWSMLSPAERRVAEAVLADPDAAMRGTVATLARAAEASDPTVIRFCRALGFAGFQGFRIALAQEDRGPAPARVHRQVEPGQPIARASEAVLDSAIAELERLRAMLDPGAVEAAARALVRAGRIEIWGFGASAAVAEDAAHKLFRLGRGVVARSDPHMQAMAAATLDGASVVLAISHTGRSRELIENVTLAAANGAVVVAITAPASPLAQQASVLLAAAVEEDTTVFTPMLSRLAHLALIDMVAVGAALISPPAIAEKLAQMKRALAGRRVAEATPKRRRQHA
ncbi:SIS domain-containing protein [Elioraea rosea]|uniref:SIS domain-containing protein n=1 Tax=Elioraea rosea TaxID=2492390 RepID=UPI001184097A|nr:SIS domain-containing protein [Elioraea rosea]